MLAESEFLQVTLPVFVDNEPGFGLLPTNSRLASTSDFNNVVLVDV
jgi:hypothetical protein